MHAEAPLVARAFTVRAPSRLPDKIRLRDSQEGGLPDGRGGLATAAKAEPSHQALGGHPNQPRGDQKRRNPHVNQTRHRGWGIVGVQGREHEVPGHRGAEGDLRCLRVAHLPHQDDIRVLTENRAELAGKREADFLIDRALVNPLHVHLDGVFTGDNIGFLVAQDIERGVEGRGLSRAGRAGDQHQPKGLTDQLLENRSVVRREVQPLQWPHRHRAVQETHDDLLAVEHRQAGDTQVKRLARH